MIIDTIRNVICEDDRVLFAYVYGSFAERGTGNDIDIAVYGAEGEDIFKLSTDLKVALHERTGLSPDHFDVRILNGLVEHGNIFALLYLRNVLNGQRLLLNRNSNAHADVLEHYGTRYRECEGLMQELLW